MGIGILGPTVFSLPFDGQTLRVKNADVVVGVVCEVHELDPTAAAAHLRMLLARPEGVDVCAPCVTRVRDHLRAKIGGAR